MSISIFSKSPTFRDALVAVCASSGMIVTGTYDSYTKLTRVDIQDVLLVHVTETDIALPDRLVELARQFAGLRIIVLCPIRMIAGLRSRMGSFVTAILPEIESAETLLSALFLAQQGYKMTLTDAQKPAPPTDAAKDGATLSKAGHADQRPVYKLSKRETAILAHLCHGGSNKSIANDLHISDATVKVHLRMAFRKIGVINRTQAAMWATQNL